ncbi:MAG: PDZ domain-containing protein, partial [Planctomycetota bacterium]
MAIISAGVIMNLVTAVLFFAVALWLGRSAESTVVGRVMTGGPAWTAGVQTGDKFTRVNDRSVRTFIDVGLATALSWDETIPMTGYRADGSRLEVELTPDSSGQRRTVGIFPINGVTLGSATKKRERAVRLGTPSAAVADQLKPGDKLIGIRVLPGETPSDPEGAADAETPTIDVVSFVDYLDAVGRYPDRPIEFTFLRPEEMDEEPEPDDERVSVIVGPTRMRTLGFQVTAQPISAIQAGSPAEKAGLQVGDQLSKVNGLAVGPEIDPLRLPNLFFESAGEPIDVEVVRTVGRVAKEVVLSVTPQERPGWIARPITGSEPLDIPALGAAFYLNPVITDVTPGGPADKAELKANDKIVSATFFPPPPADGEEAGKPVEVPFENDDVMNWNPFAYIFARTQELPDHDLALTVEREGEATPIVVKLKPAQAEDWFFPVRGFILPSDSIDRQSESAAAALQDGLKETRKVVEQMYLTLGSLL